MALKLNQNLETNIPTKNIIKSEKAHPVSFAVFPMLLSASKCRFERFIPRRLVNVASLYYVNGKVGN